MWVASCPEDLGRLTGVWSGGQRVCVFGIINVRFLPVNNGFVILRVMLSAWLIPVRNRWVWVCSILSFVVTYCHVLFRATLGFLDKFFPVAFLSFACKPTLIMLHAGQENFQQIISTTRQGLHTLSITQIIWESQQLLLLCQPRIMHSPCYTGMHRRNSGTNIKMYNALKDK